MSNPAKAKETCGYCGARRGLHTNDCVRPEATGEVWAEGVEELLAEIAALRAALKKAEELLAEAGGWAKYEGFYRLGNRINEALGGTEWGNEKLFVPGPTDEPWISETEEKLKKAEEENERLRSASDLSQYFSVVSEAEREGNRADTAEARVETLEKALREIDSKIGHFANGPELGEGFEMLMVIRLVARIAAAAMKATP